MIRLGKACLLIVVIAALIGLYLHIAQIQSRRNNQLSRSDQGAHINLAKKIYRTEFQYTGSRNYMPAFAFVQATLYSAELDDEAFFEQGKRLNVWLSVIALGLLGYAFFARFSRLYAFYSILVIGFLGFALKAPYFQPEILYYTLFAFAFIMSLETMFRPTWYKSIGVGVLFALAHLTKASAMPAVLVFAGCYGVLLLIKLVRRDLDWNQAKVSVLRALTPVLTFLILLFPYFQESKENVGEYFFNVNTRIFMWYDSWDDAKAKLQELGSYAGFLQLPPDEIPGLEKYLREHSYEQVFDRFRDGIEQFVAYGCYVEDSVHRYGYCSQVGLSILVLVFALPILVRELHRNQNYDKLHIVCFLVTLLIVYFLAAAWYVPISGHGPRVVLVLLVPFFWTVGLIVHSQRIRSLKITLFQRSIRIITIIYSLMSLALVWEIYLVVTWRADAMYGGK